MLTERKKWDIKKINFQVGDTVLVSGTGVTQLTWSSAIIIVVKTISDSTVKLTKRKHVTKCMYDQPPVYAYSRNHS